MPLTELDLEPFGIPGVLRDGFDFEAIDPFDLNSGVRNLNFLGNTRSFRLSGITYIAVESLGSGTYGTAYRCVGPDGSEYAIKYIKEKLTDKQDFVKFLKECVIQILVAEVSKDQPRGPFAPIVYEVAFDPVKEEGFLRTQRMRNSMDSLVGALSPAENDAMIADALQQFATSLKFLHTELRFNHRDMKGDNIMYIRSPDDTERWWRFIDFGMSCVTFDGMAINGGSYFEDSPSCFKKDRDLSQLMLSFYEHYSSVLSPKLMARLRNILIANVKSGKDHKCRMYKYCPKDRLKKWSNIYDFLDRPNVEVPAGEPEFVLANMKRFAADKAFIKPPAPCPAGKIVNPETNRCVSMTGPIGRKLVKSTRAVGDAIMLPPKPCPPDKILNPATRRCVKRSGKVGKGLVAGAVTGGTRRLRRHR